MKIIDVVQEKYRTKCCPLREAWCDRNCVRWCSFQDNSLMTGDMTDLHSLMTLP